MISFDRIEQMVDIAERQGGFSVVNYNVSVDGQILDHLDTIRFREVMMARQRARELDKSEDYKAAQRQGYEAALRDMKLHLNDLDRNKA